MKIWVGSYLICPNTAVCFPGVFIFVWEWKFYLEEAQIVLHLWRKEAAELNFSIFKI